MNPATPAIVPGVIQTVSGVDIDVTDPRPEDIRLEDIAHALTYVCRYGGHTSQFYSVAEHSLLVCKHLETQMGISDPEILLMALLHDASEAYLLDIPSPIKTLLPEYKRWEEQMMACIAQRFRLEYPFNPLIKQADSAVLAQELDLRKLGMLGSRSGCELFWRELYKSKFNEYQIKIKWNS